MSEIDIALEKKYISTLQKFFNLYVLQLDEYLKEYDAQKVSDIDSDGLNPSGQNTRRFFEILGLHQFKKVVPNANKDNYDFITNDKDVSLSRLIDIEDSDLYFGLDLQTEGHSLHQAALNKVIGTMMGTDLVAGNDMKFNFMSLKSDFPELYDALAWAFKNKYLSVSGEMTHIKLNQDLYEYSEIKNMLDIEGSPSGRVPGVDLLRALFVDYGGDEMDMNLRPTMSYKLKIGEKIREIMNPDTLKLLDVIETDLGGLPGGTVHGAVYLRKSKFLNPLEQLEENKSFIEVLFKNIFQMTDEQVARLPDIPDDELRTIADLLDIPLDNMMHIDWDFMQVASADGFLPFLNDPAVTTAARRSNLKKGSLLSLMKLVTDFMGHFKTHNIPIESSASKSLSHLINMYQNLGAIVIDDYPTFKKLYQGNHTGHELSAVLILPEYMLNDEIETNILRTSKTNPIWEQGIRQLTKDFKWIDANGEPQIIPKGEILLDSQFKQLKDMAKRMGIELPESPIDRRRNASKQGNVPEVNLSYAKSAINLRFGANAATRLVKVTNILNRAEQLDYGQPALGYEINEFEYLDWDEAPEKKSIYTDFFTRLRLALRAKGTENLFLRQLLAALFGGEFLDAEQRLLAIPIPDESGFAFLNLSNLSEDEMLNMAYMKQGNKNFTPDIYFGGSIGKVNYTPELVKGFRNILYTQDLLEFFNKNVSKIVSVPPVGIAGNEGVKPTASTIYSIQDMFEKSPKTFLKLFAAYNNAPGDEIFNILPDEVLLNLERLMGKMYRDGITIDDLPDVDTEGNAINYSTILEFTSDESYQNILDVLQKELKDLNEGTTIEDLPQETQDRIRARQQRMLERQNRSRARARTAGYNESVGPYSLLIDTINDTDNTITYYDSTHLGRNLDEAAYGVDELAKFFDLTEYNEYELLVTGLAQGPSHMDGKDINEAKSIIANLVTGNPTVYGNYGFKFLDRFDGTTAISFLNENTKDVFKKNLLISNRIYSGSDGSLVPTNFLDRATISPNTKILFFDASPVQTNAVYKNKIHMLEFDIGIGERLSNGSEDINRIYTQVAYEYDEVGKTIKIHHYIDNIPNNQNQEMGSVVRRQTNISRIYAIKDSAIIKSIMELHGVTDETRVIDGDGFLPLSKGVTTANDVNYDTVNIVPGRIAHSFGLVGTEDPDPDSSMYTKTLSQSNAPLLRSRKIGTLWGMFQDFTIGTIVEEFNATENMLRDTDVRLQPVINHPNFYITAIQNDGTSSATSAGAENFINKAATMFEPFGMKQDNINGFKMTNVHIMFVTDTGDNIELVGDLNQDLVLTRIQSIRSDTLDSSQITNVIQATINKNYPDLVEGSELRNMLKKNFLTFKELDTTSGKYTLSSLGDSNVGEFKLDNIQFIDSTLTAYGDTETALEMNEMFKELGIVFGNDGETGVHTYNPFVTEIMESNSYMGMGETDNRFVSGVETSSSSYFDELFKIYVDTIYGSVNSSELYPLRGRYPAPLRRRDTIFNFTDMGVEPDNVSGPEYTDGLTRHSPVMSSDIARAARLSGSAVKTILKPVGAAFKLLEKIDVADKIVMKSIKPVASVLAKGLGVAGAAIGGSTIAAGLATVYAVQELYLLAHGLIKEGDLFSDTQKLFKELRDDNPGDGAWKRFWVSTGKNAWKGLEWQQDHSLSGWIEEQLISGAGMAYNEVIERRNKNSDYVKEVASFAQKNQQIFDNINKYDPQYNENFDNINNHLQMSMQNYGTPEHQSKLNKEINNITKYGVWQNSEDLLYNGNEEFLATVDNYIKLAKAYESIGY